MRELKSVALIAFTVGCALVPAACAPSTAAQSAFDQYVGKMCTGFIPSERGGNGAAYNGRKLPVVLNFFRTSDGGPGVSFKIENRDFFDAPVSLRDDGLDFMGQSGGHWTFDYESPNHLSGQMQEQGGITGFGEMSCSRRPSI
jgi:hypothetical protein